MMVDRAQGSLPDGRIGEVRTGAVAQLGGSGIRSGIGKVAREGRVWVGPAGLAGDHQAEEFHGGTDKAVLQYDSAHYPSWIDEFPASAARFVPGGFGENFVVAGMNEATMCIGDVVQAGEAVLQVAESRQPCFKLNHRFGQKAMARRVQESGRTGWLYRVLQPGWVQAGDRITVIERPLPEWPVARLQHYLYRAIDDLAAADRLSRLPHLSVGFRSLFERRVENAAAEDWDARLSNGALTPEGMRWTETEVTEIVKETPLVRSFLLTPVDQPPSDFTAGAHIDLKVANSLTRSYSLCSLPDQKGYRIAIADAPAGRGGSRHMHAEVRIGQRILVSEPKNFFPLADTGIRHLLVAGGIGITPFLAMIEQLEHQCADWELHYLARSQDEAAFSADLKNRFPDRVHLHITDGNPTRRLDLAALLARQPQATHVYCCGSARLIESVRTAADGLPDEFVHFEAFAADRPTAGSGAAAFTAVIASTGSTIEVAAEQTLLDALRDADIEVDSSCEVGTCGTCAVRYRTGDIDHRDTALSRRERAGRIVTCVSRALGEVTLEL